MNLVRAQVVPGGTMKQNLRPILVVFLTVVLDLVGFGIFIPLMSYYAEAFSASPTQVTLLMAVYSVMQFVCAPVLGQLSDRFGRRPVLVVSIGLTALMLAGFASATELWMLFVLRALHGAMTANIGTAQACMADLTRPEDRARGMGLIGAAFGLGFTLGPFLGGVLAHVSPEVAKDCVAGAVAAAGSAVHIPKEQLAGPIWFAAGLSAVNFVLAVLLLPETRHAASGPGSHRAIRPDVLLRTLRHPAVGLVVLLNFLLVFAFALMESTFTLFAEHRHCLSPMDVGKMFGVVGVVGIIVQGGLIGRLVKRFGEAALVPVGVLLVGLGVALLPLVSPGVAMLVAFVIIASGQGVANPSLSGLLSRGTHADEQGGVLGSNQSMAALARATGPALGGVLYERVGMGVPFFVAAGLCGLAFLLAFKATARAERGRLA